MPTRDLAILDVPPRIAAVVRRQWTMAELPKIIPPAFAHVWHFLDVTKIPNTGHTLCIFHGPHDSMEIGVEVKESFETIDDVHCVATPSGRAASAAHLGSYAGLPESHAVLRAWCKTNGFELTGTFWELYSPWTNDEANLRTIIFYSIRPERPTTR